MFSPPRAPTREICQTDPPLKVRNFKPVDLLEHNMHANGVYHLTRSSRGPRQPPARAGECIRLPARVKTDRAPDARPTTGNRAAAQIVFIVLDPGVVLLASASCQTVTVVVSLK